MHICIDTHTHRQGNVDNRFLNGFAQQALQVHISDATIVDGVVKEVMLQNNDYMTCEKMFDRLFMEVQVCRASL